MGCPNVLVSWMKRGLSRDAVRASLLRRTLLGFGAVVLGSVAVLPRGVALSEQASLPDATRWRFFSEKKLKSHLFFAAGDSDSIRVSDDPACCPVVAPNGQWVATTVWNRQAIESELMILSRGMERWWPIRGYTLISCRWSPDGSRLVGYGKRRTAASVCFFAVDPIKRSAWFPDSIADTEDYDYAWDSTSTRVAICRPGSSSRNPAKVLVFSFQDRKMIKLATVVDGTPRDPRWLPGALVVSKQTASSDSSAELRFPLPER
jgi:hypothetical protein